MPLTDTVVGVYDESQEVAALIKDVPQGVDLLVMPSEQELGLSQVAVDKQLFLDRTTFAVVIVNSRSSISVLTGAIRRLIGGGLRGVYAISVHGIEPLLLATVVNDERRAVEELVAEGRLVSAQSFDEEQFVVWLSDCWQ